MEGARAAVAAAGSRAAGPGLTAEARPELDPAAFGLLKTLTEVTKPLVSGVDGLAIGIGTTLNMHCDLTVASDRSLFKTPFVDLALVPEAASSFRKTCLENCLSRAAR